MNLHTMSFAVAGGLIFGACFSLTTILSIIGVPGFLPFANLLAEGYGPYGYSVSWMGALVGAFWGFVEGFFWLGALALVYNKLAPK